MAILLLSWPNLKVSWPILVATCRQLCPSFANLRPNFARLFQHMPPYTRRNAPRAPKRLPALSLSRFSTPSKNQFFVEYSTGVEISTIKFSEKKLMMLLNIHHKYLGLIRITYEDIKKVKWDIFFGLTVCRYRKCNF